MTTLLDSSALSSPILAPAALAPAALAPAAPAPSALAPSGHESQPSLTFTALLPQVTITGNILTCDGRCVDMFGKRLTVDLVRMFLAKANLLMGRDEIIRELYQVNPKRLSKGFLQSRRACVLKLIARSRELITAGLQGSPGENIEWFFYHVDTREYELYRIRNSYPLSKQQFMLALAQ